MQDDCKSHEQIPDMKHHLAQDKQYRVGITDTKKAINRERDPTKQAKLEQKIKVLQEKRKYHAISTKLGRATKLQRSAKELGPKIADYKKTACKKPRGEASYAFLKGIEVAGGVFNDQHGGMELSLGDAMSVLEEWSKVCMIVNATYGDDQKMMDLVQSIMKASETVMTPLLFVCKFMKSQAKWDDEKIIELKNSVCDLYEAWLTVFPDQEVYPKLHDLCAHIPLFIDKWKMYGILSEESFEANHQSINKEMSNVDSSAKANVVMRRLQAAAQSDTVEVLVEIKERTTGKRRGNYRRKAGGNQNDTTVNTSEVDSEDADDYIEIDDQRIIKASWKDFRNLVMHGITPTRWQRVFENCAPETLDIAYAFR